eukprot:6187150-Prymnesium_polylepis.2
MGTVEGAHRRRGCRVMSYMLIARDKALSPSRELHAFATLQGAPPPHRARGWWARTCGFAQVAA